MDFTDFCFPGYLLCQPGPDNNRYNYKKGAQTAKRQVKIEQGKLLFTPLAGPVYTPELGFTIAGGVMLSYEIVNEFKGK